MQRVALAAHKGVWIGLHVPNSYTVAGIVVEALENQERFYFTKGDMIVEWVLMVRFWVWVALTPSETHQQYISASAMGRGTGVRRTERKGPLGARKERIGARQSHRMRSWHHFN